MIDLRALVREVMAEHIDDTVDPTQLDKFVLARIPCADYGDALLYLLPAFIRETQGQDRRVSIPPTVEPQFVEEPALVPVRPRVNGARSSITARSRDEFRAWLDSVMTGADGIRMKRADMTFEDLMAAAAIRRGLATANSIEADHLENQARVLREHKARTLGDLSPAIIRELATR